LNLINDELMPIVLVAVFVVATLVGYKLITNVPSLLHTPLMSGMNAISGVTVVGAIVTTALAIGVGSRVLGMAAVVLATVNIVTGFGVTHRMLRMFKRSDKKDGDA